MALTWEQHQQNIFGGESGGDYDALFGYHNRPDGAFSNVKVSQMPVGDVIDFTDPSGTYGRWVKSQLGYTATPVGAYQVVGTTLRDAVKALGIDPEQKFDKATQDKIGQYILKTQGTGAWEGYGKGGASMQNKPAQMAQQQQPQQQSQGLLGSILGGQGIGGALGLSDDFRDRLKMGLLLGSDPQRFAPMITGIQARGKERRAEAKEQKKLELAQKGRNATADYLDSIGQTDLGNLVRQGAITGANALSAVPKPDKEKTFQYQALAADLLRTGAAKTEAEALQMALSQTKAGTTVHVGPQGQPLPPPPSGYVYRYNEDQTVMLNDQGVPMVAPLAGSKADIEAKTREEKLSKTRTMEERGQSVVSRSVQEALNILDTDTGIIPVAGTYGKFAADYLPDQEARNLKRTLEALQANTAFTRLQEMRDASQTGGALGNVSNVELGLLMSAYGSISQDLDPSLLRKNLEEIERIMGKIENDPIASAFYNEGVDLRGSDLDKQVKSGALSGGPKRLRFDAQGNIIND
jgi:hypothetical protein